MGNKQIHQKHIHPGYSGRKIDQVLNEADGVPRRLRPYGSETGKFAYRSIFETDQTGPDRRRVERTAKKASRQQAKRELSQQNQKEV